MASEGLGLPVKAAIAAGIAVAAAAGVVFALAGDDPEPGAAAQPAPGVAAPVVPLVPAPRTPAPTRAEPPAAQGSVPSEPGRTPAAPTPSPAKPKAPAPVPPASPAPKPKPSPTPSPTPGPAKPSPSPSPSVPQPAQGFRLAGLGHAVFGDHSGPELQTGRSSWVWQRWGLRIADRRFTQGITVNSRSSVEITLNRQCTAFSARAGVDDLSLFTDGTVRFSVYADGQRLWRSDALGFGDPAAAVDVSLTGRTTLRLVVEQAGQGSLPTLASWADAVISCR
ncbi:NPCBM/NEW2 domain-containing protein [Streptomyces sp. WM6372]|uniref:NPCBM/NEW2 domain-containing protein n=1 Tax=Streptomyces sp. WM6372 TaxID=1415555 RepID=UPI0006AD95C7|nr:NPCBM/NEW2 domain-containing protein [Streptomyces sp. WM6372]